MGGKEEEFEMIVMTCLEQLHNDRPWPLLQLKMSTELATLLVAPKLCICILSPRDIFAEEEV